MRWPVDSKWIRSGCEDVKDSMENFGFLGGGFKHFLFSPLFGEDSHFD